MERRDVISVPRDAIVRCSGQNMVLLSQDGTLLPCAVCPGEVADGKVMIESGLREGDQIVVAITDQQRRKLTEKLSSGDDAGD
jgi:multidrug efflux pump subunit AcrA (membrane-fusion protein)